MGWNIYEVENTVRLTPEQADELGQKLADTSMEHFGDGDWPLGLSYVKLPDSYQTVPDGLCQPTFNSDNMEHMDWLTYNAEACRLIAGTGTTGRVCFGSFEGGGAGKFWGVEFRSGKYRPLSGQVAWSPGTSLPD